MMMTLLLVHWVSHIDMTCTPEVYILQQHVRNSQDCCLMSVLDNKAGCGMILLHSPCIGYAPCLLYLPVPLIGHGTDAAHQDKSP